MNSDKLDLKLQTLQDTINNSCLINQLDLMQLRNEFLNSKPFPHIFIDDMWDNDFLKKVALEAISLKNWAGEKDFFGSKKKKWQNNWDKLPDDTNKFLAYLNQSTFINIIEFITNENGLIGDPHLEGGGIHSTGNDGFLKFHIDFNWNKTLKLYRRINTLVYLNKDWKKEYGGQIELASMSELGKFESIISLEPIFNRTLIFITDENSYHGQPNPVCHPLNTKRNSIAAYYYSSQQPNKHSDKKRINTSYVDQSGKKFNNNLFSRIIKKLIR
jgi:Rps23 Pro-64 3,4-dihydroxylase Tpa1-like proline 4-hydroxylase